MSIKLTGVELERVFNRNLPGYIHDRLDIEDIQYTPLSDRDNRALIARYHTDLTIDPYRFAPSGPHRESVWADAWSETLERFKNSRYDIRALSPPFIDRASYVRWNGRYVYPVSPDFESRLYAIIREWVFREIVFADSRLYEFGAGSCFNIATYCKMFPKASAVALDWAPASVEIALSLKRECGLNVDGRRFDFFNPSHDITITGDSVVLTVGALEQIGSNFNLFLDYIMSNNPRRVVFIEPTVENYNKDNPFDEVAILYHNMRNYLTGLKPAIYDLQQHGKIRVVEDLRTTLGSKYHEGYQILAWEPVN